MKKIDITKRTYQDILNHYQSLYPNTPPDIFQEFSGNIEELSELINLVATDCLYPFSRFAAYGFASRCDYSPTEKDGATVQLTFTLKVAMAKTLPIGYKVSGISSITGENLIYELTAIGNSGGTATITVDAKQQVSFADISIGLTSGSNDWSIYPVGEYLNIIKSSISLTVGVDTWTRVNNFDASISTDKHYIIFYTSDGRAYILFGNGITGEKPTSGLSMVVDFATTSGSIGKVAAGDLTTNLGNDADVSSVTNAASNGGNDSESVQSIIRNSQANVRLRDGIFSLDDIEIYCVGKSTLAAKIVKAHAIAGTGPSLGTATVDIITNDMVNLTAGEKTTLDAEMKLLTPLQAFSIFSQDPNYLNQAIVGNLNVRAGFAGATVQSIVKFSQQIVSSPIDNYVIDYFNTYGIDVCRTNVINPTFGHAFASSENDALSFIINEWTELLRGKDGREYGDKLELSDLYTIANEMYDFGVNEYTVTTPTSNVTPTADQIIKGSVTVNLV